MESIPLRIEFTVGALLDQLEKIIDDLGPEVRDGEWNWSFLESGSDEKHVDNFRESLRLTREAFKTEGDTEMDAVYVNNSSVVALCGNTPHSKARARYIATCNPRLMRFFIEIMRSAYVIEETNANA